jgi:hypothetical protein
MKIYLKTVAGILLFFAIALGALTLLRNLNRQPSMVITSTACEPPCWYGITPGETTSWEAFAILDQLPGVNQDTVLGGYDREDKLNKIFWYFERPAEDSIGSIYFEDDRATAVTILTINSVKLAELFEKLGQPEKYWAEVGHGEDREYVNVLLFYPTQGYLIDMLIDLEFDSNQVEIKGTTPVYRVTYFAPEMFEELLGSRILIDKAVLARKGSWQAWTGYGRIEVERE